MENMMSPKDFAPLFAVELTKLDGKVWKVEDRTDRDYSHYCEVHCEDGVRLGIGTGAWNVKDKFHISGSYNHFTGSDGRTVRGTYKEPTPEMNVSRSKGPALIAKDTVRRILGEIRTLSEGYAAKAIESHAYAHRVYQTACRVGAVVEAPVRVGRSPHTPVDMAHPHIDLYRSKFLPDFSGDLKAHDGTVTFERFEVSTDEAIAMLKALMLCRA